MTLPSPAHVTTLVYIIFALLNRSHGVRDGMTGAEGQAFLTSGEVATGDDAR